MAPLLLGWSNQWSAAREKAQDEHAAHAAQVFVRSDGLGHRLHGLQLTAAWTQSAPSLSNATDRMHRLPRMLDPRFDHILQRASSASRMMRATGMTPQLSSPIYSRTLHKTSALTDSTTSKTTTVSSISNAAELAKCELDKRVNDHATADATPLEAATAGQQREQRAHSHVEVNSSPEALGPDSRARCLEALQRPCEDRTEEDLVILAAWADKIKFRDAEVKQQIDRVALCKAMRIKRAHEDEMIISQGEEGDAFFAVFAGAASVYVAYDIDIEAGSKNQMQTSKGKGASASVWPDELVRLTEERIRRMRRHSRGEFTPELPSRFRGNTTAPEKSPSPLVSTTSTVIEEGGAEAQSAPQNRRSSMGSRQLTQSHRRRSTACTPSTAQANRRISLRHPQAPTSKIDSSPSVAGAAAARVVGLQRVYVYQEYDSFGDLALLSGAPRSASVVAEVGTILIRVERADYDAVLREAALEAVRARAAFLATLPVLGKLALPHLMRIASYVRREDHPKGLRSDLRRDSAHKALPEGQVNNDIIIVQHGLIEVRTSGKRPRTMLTLGSGSCIGALTIDDSKAPLELLPSLSTSQHSSCTLLRLTRTELAFRAGRRVMMELEFHEATTWLVRLHSPGPLKALVTPTALSHFHASVGTRVSVPLIRPSSSSACIRPALKRCESAPTLHRPMTSHSAKMNVEEPDTWNLIEWMKAKREELKVRVAESAAKEERRRQEKDQALKRSRVQLAAAARASKSWQSRAPDSPSSRAWVDLTASLAEGIKASSRAASVGRGSRSGGIGSGRNAPSSHRSKPWKAPLQ